MKEAKQNRFWRWMAFFYDQFYERFPPYQKLHQEIIKYFLPPLSPFPNVLDAGCGTGLLSLKLARMGFCVVAMDRSSEMLARLEKKKEREKLANIRIWQKDLNTPLPGRELSFQRILLIHTLYTLPNPQETLQNLAAMLSDDGEMILCNPTRNLTSQEICMGGISFLREAVRQQGILSFFIFFSIALAMSFFILIIQWHKAKRVFHYWNEEEMTRLLRNSGLKIRWAKKSCLVQFHLLVSAVKER
jgi:2-polyprenyl-3-methyl-5-hydroxy-6-metoxy-1,4-benzoquinol methylase